MEELVQKAAEVLGWPAAMVERSARARAEADGVAVEAVLSAWGGGEVAAAAPEPGGDEAPAAVPAREPAAVPATAAAPEVEVLGGLPDEDPVAEEEPEPEAEPVRRRRPAPVPAWLAATFVVVPSIAFFYALFFPNGPDCGEGPQLAIDPVSGVAVNCDGTAFGSAEVNFIALGQEIYSVNCAVCHGEDGAGLANFPQLSGAAVLATFPAGSCSDHLEWVSLGTLGWPEATYGATDKPVGGSGAQMPAFGTSLSEEELAAVVIFERVSFGGQERLEAQADCGVGEPDGGEVVEAAG